MPTAKELEQIAVFERTRPFFSSKELLDVRLDRARAGAAARPHRVGEAGAAASSRTCRSVAPEQKAGICAVCHSGPMLNETNQFFPAPPLRRGGRFQSMLVSELNEAGNPVHDFVFKNPDGTTTLVVEPGSGSGA